jgi:DNA-binding beta-propeller fold protein YncE
VCGGRVPKRPSCAEVYSQNRKGILAVNSQILKGTLVAGLLACAPAFGGSIFMGAYPSSLLVFDDAKQAIAERIPLATGLPTSIKASMDRKKIYVVTNDHSGIEVVDVATRKVINHFTLNTPTKHYRFNGGTPDPTDKYFYAVTTEMDKLVDHYEIGKPKYTIIDLAAQKIAKTFDIAKEEETAGVGGGRGGMEISKDGKYLYQFGSRVVILSTDDFHVVDRLDLSKPEEPGLENVGFGGNLDSLAEPGKHISLFNAQDPYVHNRVFGIARFDLDSRQANFTPIGPSPAAMTGLQVAPDEKNAWAVVTTGTLGNKRCEFWHMDLTTNTVTGTSEFSCKSRFSFGMSASGKKLYIYGASFEIEVYDAATMKYEKTWDLNNDITGAGMIQFE